ncbi:MAG: hypothetical protein C4308_10750, partial [Chitinophagaceae bacterium]
ITAVEFQSAINKALELSPKKYHINKFNCYDYAVEIFNTVASDMALPIHHTRFPFIFGKGGSPTCIYQDLKAFSRKGFSSAIRFGNLLAPISSTRMVKKID